MNGKSTLCWVGGILLILLGVLFLFSVPPVGFVILGVGVYILPAVEFDVQLGKVVAWIGCVTLVLLGLLFFSETAAGGLLGVVGGLLAAPPVRRVLTSQFGLEFGSGVTAVVVLVIAGAGVGFVYMEETQTEASPRHVHEMNEQFTVEGSTSDIAFTVEDVRTVSRQSQNSEQAEASKQLLVVLQLSNTGDSPVTVWKDDLKVATQDGANTETASGVTSAIPTGNDSIDLNSGETSPRIEPGETLRRTFVFEVTESGTYLFGVTTDEQFSEADNHYVALGRVDLGA